MTSSFGISCMVFLLRPLLGRQHCTNDNSLLFLWCLFAFSRVMSKDSVSKGVCVCEGVRGCILTHKCK